MKPMPGPGPTSPLRAIGGSFLAGLGLLLFLLYTSFVVFFVGDEGLLAIVQSPITWAFTILVLFVMPFALFVVFKRRGALPVLDAINASWVAAVIAFLMFYYGHAKIIRKFFDITYLTQDTNVSLVPSFDLAWYFFGRSNAQELLIGLMELVPALMLFFRRTRLLGALLMLPVAGNVLFTNVFNKISGLTFWVAPFAFFGLLFILAPHVRQLVNMALQLVPPRPVLSKRWGLLRTGVKYTVVLAAAIPFFTSLYFAFFGSSNHSSNRFLGGFELASLRVNGDVIDPSTDSTHYYKSIFLEPQMRWNSASFDRDNASNAYLTVDWKSGSDSVITFLQRDRSVESPEVDPLSRFDGIYKLNGNELLVSGTQYGDTIMAVYQKKPLKDYTWFW